MVNPASEVNRISRLSSFKGFVPAFPGLLARTGAVVRSSGSNKVVSAYVFRGRWGFTIVISVAVFMDQRFFFCFVFIAGHQQRKGQNQQKEQLVKTGRTHN